MSATTYTLRELADIAGAELLLNAPDRDGFTELLTDSRKLVHPEETVFFALSGERHDGHRFILDQLTLAFCNANSYGRGSI
jgi:alanine racemase